MIHFLRRLFGLEPGPSLFFTRSEPVRREPEFISRDLGDECSCDSCRPGDVRHFNRWRAPAVWLCLAAFVFFGAVPDAVASSMRQVYCDATPQEFRRGAWWFYIATTGNVQLMSDYVSWDVTRQDRYWRNLSRRIGCTF